MVTLNELNLLLMCVKERIAYLEAALHDVRSIANKLSGAIKDGNRDQDIK